MKFLVDAQLPARCADWLRQQLAAIAGAFTEHRFVELRRDALVMHQ